LLNHGGIDAVAIAVPPHAQYEIAKAAIEQGLHVFAEKPLAANLDQAEELRAIAAEQGIVHCVDFMFPEIAEWQKVKELLDAGGWGVLQHVAVEWTWLARDLLHNRSTWRTDVAAGGGLVSHYFSHGLHYLEHFAGPITGAKALLSHSPRSVNGGEVGVDLVLRFRDGATGSAHVSCNSPGRVTHRLEFQCEHGVISLANSNAVVDNFRIHTYSEAGETALVEVEDGDARPGEDERVKVVRKLARRFVDACADGTDVRPSFTEGLRVQELIELVRRNQL